MNPRSSRVMGEAAVLHYPDGNSVLIVQEKSVLGIFGGIAKTFSPPEEVEVESGASLVGVRASSVQDFVLADNRCVNLRQCGFDERQGHDARNHHGTKRE